MTEQQTTETTTDPAGTDSTAEQPFDSERAMEKIRKANSEALNLRKRVKELEQYEAAARAADDAKKTEAEKFAEQLAAVTRRADDLQVELLRERVARKAKLPDELADRLRGTTIEELEADAKALAAYASQVQQSTREERRKAPDPSQGQGMALNGDPLLDSLKSKLGI